MNAIITFIADHLFELVTGAGLLGMYFANENKRTLRIDNDKKLLDECYDHIDRLTRKMNEMEARYEAVLKQKDQRIAELEQKVKALEEELDGMKARRNSKGQFTKRNA